MERCPQCQKYWKQEEARERFCQECGYVSKTEYSQRIPVHKEQPEKKSGWAIHSNWKDVVQEKERQNQEEIQNQRAEELRRLRQLKEMMQEEHMALMEKIDQQRSEVQRHKQILNSLTNFIANKGLVADYLLFAHQEKSEDESSALNKVNYIGDSDVIPF